MPDPFGMPRPSTSRAAPDLAGGLPVSLPTPEAAPVPLARAFGNLATLPDELNAWVNALAEAGRLAPADALVLGVALQEWVANLVQHATWHHAPFVEVLIDTATDPPGCTVDDTSVGFELDRAIEARRRSIEALPERGMGLLMLGSIADELSYAPHGPTHHRLRFRLRRDDSVGLDLTNPASSP